MKAHELLFLKWVLDKPEHVSVRDVINAQATVPYKRCWYYLEKWARKGWYEWGVTMDLGWLTLEGIKMARTLTKDVDAPVLTYTALQLMNPEDKIQLRNSIRRVMLSRTPEGQIQLQFEGELSKALERAILYGDSDV